jgi:hypothetical protein
MHVTGGLLQWVSPFGHLRINAYLQLPEAYRSLSRPSSAPDAKAFPLRPFSLDHTLHIGLDTLFENYAGFKEVFLATLYLPIFLNKFHNLFSRHLVPGHLPLCCLACLNCYCSVFKVQLPSSC